MQDKLGFGDREFVVNNEVGVLYDADETDNLPKKLTELGAFILNLKTPPC